MTVPFDHRTGHADRPIARRVEKQLTLAEWEEGEPGRWWRRTNEWNTPTEDEIER